MSGGLAVLSDVPKTLRRPELTLRLADGRVLDFLVADEEGAIRYTHYPALPHPSQQTG